MAPYRQKNASRIRFKLMRWEDKLRGHGAVNYFVSHKQKADTGVQTAYRQRHAPNVLRAPLPRRETRVPSWATHCGSQAGGKWRCAPLQKKKRVAPSATFRSFMFSAQTQFGTRFFDDMEPYRLNYRSMRRPESIRYMST